MVNFIKNQIKMVNFTKPYPFNMVNLTKSIPFWWTFVQFDYIFGSTFGQKCHFSKMYWSNVTCVFHTLNFSQNGHTLWSMWTHLSSWPSEKPHFLVVMIGLVESGYFFGEGSWQVEFVVETFCVLPSIWGLPWKGGQCLR